MAGLSKAGIPASSLCEPGQFPQSRICMDANPAMNSGELIVRTGTIPAEQDLHGCKSCV
jgi:hypothetical protein